MSKFCVKGTLNGITKSIELERGKEVDLDRLKSSLEKLFGENNLTLRFKSTEGKVETLYQNFHLEAALKDCEKSGAKYVLIQLFGGSGPKTTTVARETVPTMAQPERTRSFTGPSKGATTQPTSSPKFCENCGTPLTPAAKFCSTCGTTVTAQTQSESQKTPSQQDSGDICPGCKKSVSSGIRALDHLWHKECFSCSKCRKSLLTGSFVSGDDGKPLCGDCYDENFGKRCNKCHKTISGVFLNIDGKDYHRECFVCSSCKSPFDGGYFVKDGNNVCKNCT